MNLKELANHLNLSQTTVSRALNGYPEVGEETRRRVSEAALRLGYRPNTHARRLATGKSHAIGHVITANRYLMIDPHFADFMAGASEVYGVRGFDVLLNVTDYENEESVYRRFAQSGIVDGVVVQGARRADPRIAILKDIGLPFIVHGRQPETEEGYAWLDIDNLGGFFKAAKLLTDLGHRRIALINGLEAVTFAAHRRAGYEEALKARGIGLDPSLITSDAMTEENGYRQARALLSREARPTALLCSSMLLVSGAIRACHEMKLAIGTDVSLIAHDDGLPFLNAEGLEPPLTTVRSSIRKAGARVAELLLAMVANPAAEKPQELWPVDLIVRGSTGAGPG